MKIKRGFTLIELLVVIAIIGILIGLLLPAVQAVRNAARRSQCSNNLKQWALAVTNYEGVFGSLPGSRFNYLVDQQGYTQDTGWLVALLPYVEEQNLYDQFEARTYTFAAINQPVVQFGLELNQCPSAEEASFLVDIAEYYGGPDTSGLIALTGDYAGNGGWIEGVAPASTTVSSRKKQGAVPVYMGGLTPPKVQMASIRDGASNTILMWESAGAEWYYLSNNKVQIGTWDDWMSTYAPVLLMDENAGTGFPSGTLGTKAYFAGWAGVNSFPARLWNDDGTNWGDAQSGFSKVINVTNAFRSPFSFHSGVVIVAYADGRVDNIQESVAPNVFFSLSSRFGGESVEAP